MGKRPSGKKYRQVTRAQTLGCVWFALRNLQHDALLQVYDCGTATVNGEAIIYCVREPSDGDLEGPGRRGSSVDVRRR